MNEIKVKIEDPAFVKYPMSRVERIEHRHQQRIMRIKVTNTLLDQKLESQISHLTRKEKYYERKHTAERKSLRDDLLKIHQTDESYAFLSPKHLIRLAQYYQEKEQETEVANRQKNTQPYASPSSLQKFNKVVGDIAVTRNQQLHYNHVSCVHAWALHNVVNKKKKTKSGQGHLSGDSDSEEESNLQENVASMMNVFANKKKFEDRVSFLK